MKRVALVFTMVGVLALALAAAPAIAHTNWTTTIDKITAQSKGKGKDKGKETSKATVPFTSSSIPLDGTGGLIGMGASALSIGGVILIRITIQRIRKRWKWPAKRNE